MKDGIFNSLKYFLAVKGSYDFTGLPLGLRLEENHEKNMTRVMTANLQMLIYISIFFNLKKHIILCIYRLHTDILILTHVCQYSLCHKY